MREREFYVDLGCLPLPFFQTQLKIHHTGVTSSGSHGSMGMDKCLKAYRSDIIEMVVGQGARRGGVQMKDLEPSVCM